MNLQGIRNIIIYLVSIYIEKIGLAMLIGGFSIISIIGFVYLLSLQDFIHSILPSIATGTGKISCTDYNCIIHSTTKEYIGIGTFFFVVIGIIEAIISIKRGEFFSIAINSRFKGIIWALGLLYILSIVISILYLSTVSQGLSIYFIAPLTTSILAFPNILIGSFLFFGTGKLREYTFSTK